MKKSIFIILISLITSLAFAGSINNDKEKVSTKLVSGKVVDKVTGEEIAGAQVKIADKIVYSDFNGNFSATIFTTKTEVVVTSISYNGSKLNIDPFSYEQIVVELESK